MRADCRVLMVVGARPQFIKAAPISAALAAAGIAERMIHTGQHFDAEMSDVFFEEFGMRAPAVNLGIHGEGHGAMTGRMLEALEREIVAARPSWMLVLGDTNSTLAGALAASKLNVPVAHVEAGLRSFRRSMPEEINRVLTDHVSDLLFAPTRQARAHLAREGITRGVHVTGDVMYDACLRAIERVQGRTDVLAALGVEPGAYDVATIHRAESVDTPDNLRGLIAFLTGQCEERPIVFPVHPRTRLALERYGITTSPLKACAPLGYLAMAQLLANCVRVLTDSGGLQKEAYFHGKPCVTLRDETEWTETIECGWNRLWRCPDYRPRRRIDEYGDGHAATRIAQLLCVE